MFLIESPDGLAWRCVSLDGDGGDGVSSTPTARALVHRARRLRARSNLGRTVRAMYMRRFFPDRSLSALGVVQVVIHQYNPASFTRKSL
jgi:hypothetical protein